MIAAGTPRMAELAIAELADALAGEEIEFRSDETTRLLYSTDASIYQIEPLGVVFPKNGDELAAAVATAARFQVPVLARGSGSSLAGQSIGAALITDCSKYLNQIVELDWEQGTAFVEPGVILDSLNKAGAGYGLQFGPDPASSERATLGGCISTNATGAHSILYGMAADHLLRADAILADGSLATFSEIPIAEAQRRAANGSGLESKIYHACLSIRDEHGEAIRRAWPQTWRRAAGYNLNYLLPWSPNGPPLWDTSLPYPPISAGTINLAPLFAGAEGTLAVIQRATVRLVPRPKQAVLGVLAFGSQVDACDAAPALLELQPSAIELIPPSLIRLTRGVPAYAPQLAFLGALISGDEPPALLVVEFSGDEGEELTRRVRAMHGYGEIAPVMPAETATEQKSVWLVRKMGLGILASRPGDVKSLAFIEDISVPVEHLGEFVRELDRILSEHGVSGDFYAHASAGCLHARPLINIKSSAGKQLMRQITAEAVELALRLKGSISGEHGVGLSRTEWLPKMYGEEVISAFRLLKDAADPLNLLNPGKILDGPPMETNLRYGEEYRVNGWRTALDFTPQGGLAGAIELCNGAGVCRKSEGVMCPSFQALGEEMHSTRGRANLLRLLISNQFSDLQSAEQAVYEALDLCLACKGCRSECPSAVDVAKLRYEYLHHYHQNHPRKLRDYLFGKIDRFARIGQPFAPIANPILASPTARRAAERWLKLSATRKLPALSRHNLHSLAASRIGKKFNPHGERCLVLADAFSEYMDPRPGLAALEVLAACGTQPVLLPVIGAGRTLISKGFLDEARRHARRVVDTIQSIDPEGKLPIIGIEPSEIYTLRDEYLDLLPNEAVVKGLAKRAFMIDEYLVRPDESAAGRRLSAAQFAETDDVPSVILHGHCYQKAQPPAEDGYPVGMGATKVLLECAGYRVESIEAGCCGMAGAFGYEAEHYQLSMQIGELSLFPAIKKKLAEDGSCLVSASGFSCQAQIADGVGREALHPIELVHQRLAQRGIKQSAAP